MDFLNVELVLAVITSSLATAGFNSLLGRRKTRIEIDDKINQMASRLIDDQREEIDALNAHIMNLQNQIVVLNKEYQELKAENKQLREENISLREEFSSIKGRGLGG